MAAHNQVGAGFYVSLRQYALVFFRRLISFNSPMDKYDDMVILSVGFCDALVQKRRIIGLEKAGL